MTAGGLAASIPPRAGGRKGAEGRKSRRLRVALFLTGALGFILVSGCGTVLCSTPGCPVCAGKGEFVCQACKQKGTVQCTACKGKPRWKCEGCKGDWRL